jgi:hypothetical protein
MSGFMPPLSQYAFMAWCSVKKKPTEVEPNQSQGSRIGVALICGLDDRGFDSRWGLVIFLFSTASRPALRPTHPPIQWVPWAVSSSVKLPERESVHSRPNSEVKNA